MSKLHTDLTSVLAELKTKLHKRGENLNAASSKTFSFRDYQKSFTSAYVTVLGPDEAVCKITIAKKICSSMLRKHPNL